jgi:hypothetical protein
MGRLQQDISQDRAKILDISHILRNEGRRGTSLEPSPTAGHGEGCGPMIILAVGAALVVSMVLCRAIRRVVIIGLVIVAVAVAVSRITSTNRSIESYRLLVSLLGHVLWVALERGAVTFVHLAESWLRRLHV